MSYATASDVQSRMTKALSSAEQAMCEVLLEDAAVIIDSYNEHASTNAKKIVSCKMVIRAMSDGGDAAGVPIGASQGSMSALGYSQSWTMGSGSVGEMYLTKLEKKLLGAGNKIGSYSPTQEMVPEAES